MLSFAFNYEIIDQETKAMLLIGIHPRFHLSTDKRTRIRFQKHERFFFPPSAFSSLVGAEQDADVSYHNQGKNYLISYVLKSSFGLINIDSTS